MKKSQRPLSPHLQIYRPQLTSVLSIIHRATGVLLALGTLLLVYWLLAVAAGPGAYAAAQGFLGSWFGRFILFICSFSLFYHLCNGIRHLCWDIGVGFDIETTYTTGKLVVVVSILVTLMTWLIAYNMRGSGL